MDTFKKRQRELKRLDRQRDKAARRNQRKLDRAGATGDTPPDGTPQIEAEAETDSVSVSDSSATLEPTVNA